MPQCIETTGAGSGALLKRCDMLILVMMIMMIMIIMMMIMTLTTMSEYI